MQSELFLFIQTLLPPGIKTYDLWNDQIETAEEEDLFPPPAVFLEILPFETQPLLRGREQAEITFVIHYVQQMFERSRRKSKNQDEALEKYGDKKKIEVALRGKNNGSTIGSILKIAELPDHKHKGYLDQRTRFKVRMYNDNAKRRTVEASPQLEIDTTP